MVKQYYLCIDVDDPDKKIEYLKKQLGKVPRKLEWLITYQYLKGVYGFQHLPKRVVKTRNGYHVYYPVIVEDPVKNQSLRFLLGDDVFRLEYEAEFNYMYYNICYTSSEKEEREVKK